MMIAYVHEGSVWCIAMENVICTSCERIANVHINIKCWIIKTIGTTTYRFGGGRTGQGDDDSSGDELHVRVSSRVFELVVAMNKK